MATKRLIDANEIYDAVERRYRVSSGIEHRCERDLLDLICSVDTVDAVEVVHGRWESIPGNNTYERCSVCKDCYIHADWIGGDKWYYCPNCGAKMDGDGNG